MSCIKADLAFNDGDELSIYFNDYCELQVQKTIYKITISPSNKLHFDMLNQYGQSTYQPVSWITVKNIDFNSQRYNDADFENNTRNIFGYDGHGIYRNYSITQGCMKTSLGRICSKSS